MNSIATEQISTLKMSIYRYDPDTGNKPFMQEMDIDIPSDKDIMVLDALHLAKEQDPSIRFAAWGWWHVAGGPAGAGANYTRWRSLHL